RMSWAIPRLYATLQPLSVGRTGWGCYTAYIAELCVRIDDGPDSSLRLRFAAFTPSGSGRGFRAVSRETGEGHGT
ncbi:MAG: hypothetical protein Q7R41_12160, partial [Phycisphaerales bacterium]|nr:hypothetical protein [Phycisphaerales bacterium]